MATILLAWELGAGFGHMANLRTLGIALKERGHRLVAALRDTSGAAAVFGDIPFVAAPAMHALPENPVSDGSTFADLLYNNGWAEPGPLSSLCRAWQSLYDLVAPDVVVMEFSPIALLALQGRPTRKVIIGTGFYTPPDVSPLPDLSEGRSSYPERRHATERRVLDNANAVLGAQGLRPLDYLAQLYTRVDVNYFATFPELDHYGQRPGARYCGTIAGLSGEAPDWPAGKGPRIFAYLRPFPGLKALLGEFRRLGAPTVIYLAGTDTAPLRNAAPANIRFSQRPLDLQRTAAECDLAVLYAPHDSTAEVLLAGKPILQIPQHFEQRIVAGRSAALGASVTAAPDDEEQIVRQLRELLDEPRYAEAAQQFSRRHASRDRAAILAQIVHEIEALAEADATSR